MKILISGGCKNGKSSLAQKMACNLAEERGVSPIYFATMISHDSEDDERIKKHREERKGMGFETLEFGKDISLAFDKICGRVVLFDSLTALVANEMFDGRTNFDFSEEGEKKIISKLQAELSVFLEKASSVVIVSDAIFCDGKIYDKITELYRKILAAIENFLSEKCDSVYEMVCGRAILKNGKNFLGIGETEMDKSKKTHLIIGGSYQGKASFAKKEYSLSDSEIFICNREGEPDFSKRCLSHFENYVAYCLKNDISPNTDFFNHGEEKIIICDDIFCGVVPVDSFERKLREKTGILLQKISENATLTRIFCGKPEKIF